MNLDELKKQYILEDNSFNVPKLFCDLSFWLDFVHEYGLDKFNCLRDLREYLGAPEEFHNKMK